MDAGLAGGRLRRPAPLRPDLGVGGRPRRRRQGRGDPAGHVGTEFRELLGLPDLPPRWHAAARLPRPDLESGDAHHCRHRWRRRARDRVRRARRRLRLSPRRHDTVGKRRPRRRPRAPPAGRPRRAALAERGRQSYERRKLGAGLRPRPRRRAGSHRQRHLPAGDLRGPHRHGEDQRAQQRRLRERDDADDRRHRRRRPCRDRQHAWWYRRLRGLPPDQHPAVRRREPRLGIRAAHSQPGQLQPLGDRRCRQDQLRRRRAPKLPRAAAARRCG